MTVEQLIDAAHEHWLSIGQADVSDATFRARILLHLQQAGEERWNEHLWWFRQASASITVASSGSGPLPANFGSFGKEGFVIVPSARVPMQWKEPRDLMRLREMNPNSSSTQPTYYTLHGSDFEGAFTLQVYPKPPANLSVKAYYVALCPTFTDGGDELPAFPLDFHRSVLLRDVKSQLMMDEGDLRAQEERAKADRTCNRLWAEHIQGRQQRSRGPRYGTGVYR